MTNRAMSPSKPVRSSQTGVQCGPWYLARWRGGSSRQMPISLRAWWGKAADTLPFPVTRPLLERGQERYTIFCVPCHDSVGNGQGIIVQRGFRQPPSFHLERLREAPIGHFFAVMTNGFGAMADYATQIPPQDRWAITAYIRALQLSQHATLTDVPAEVRQRLESESQR